LGSRYFIGTSPGNESLRAVPIIKDNMLYVMGYSVSAYNLETKKREYLITFIQDVTPNIIWAAPYSMDTVYYI
jgi:hypothetical protein